MKPPVDVDDVVSRVRRNWMKDGLAEIMLGLLFVLMGGGSLAKLALPRWLSLDLLTSALTVAGALGLVWGFKKAKERITFPRCGYVALPQPTRMSRAAMFAMFAAFGVIFTLLMTQFNRMTVPVSALVFALILTAPGLRVKGLRMIWEGVLTLLFGAFLFWFIDLDGSRGLMALTGMIGAAMVIIGAVRLRNFLKSNPLAQEPEA